MNIHGYAEPIGQSLMIESKKTLETTPTVCRLRTSRDYSSESDVTPGNQHNIFRDSSNNLSQIHYLNVYFADGGQNDNGSVKRNYAQMSNGYWSDGSFKSILSPIQENLEVPLKRAHLESKGARRLFSPNSKVDTHMNKKIDTFNTGYESDELGPCSSYKFNTSVPFSPTSNLPNFVLDGTAPHLLEMSPQKSKENIDWLTKMRKEKYPLRNCNSSEKLSSPKNHMTPVRRIIRSKSTEPRKTPKSPLLQFLKPTVKDFNSDLQALEIKTELRSASEITP